MELPLLDRPREGLTRADQMLLAREFTQGARSNPGSQGLVAIVAFGAKQVVH
jgi:hypothetical protein